MGLATTRRRAERKEVEDGELKKEKNKAQGGAAFLSSSSVSDKLSFPQFTNFAKAGGESCTGGVTLSRQGVSWLL